jgi:hypothetical protein
VYRSVDAPYTDSAGTTWQVRSTMTDAEDQAYRATVATLPGLIDTWSAHETTMSLTIVEVPHAINSLSSGCGGPYVAPWNIQSDVDSLAPAGAYDSIIAGWSLNGAGNPPMNYWGCSLWNSLYSQAHGATWSNVLAPAASWWFANAEYPAEAFVHEWLLGVGAYFITHGHSIANVEQGSAFGFSADARGSWKTWYSAWLQGTIPTGTGGLTGVGPTLWSIGPHRL